jgi:hypothetical protein
MGGAALVRENIGRTLARTDEAAEIEDDAIIADKIDTRAELPFDLVRTLPCALLAAARDIRRQSCAA